MEPWHTGELLGFDFETTGVDRCSDVPVSFALIRSSGGEIVEQVVGLIDPGRDIPAEATAIHGITAERARAEGQPLGEALETIADVLADAANRAVPVVGMNVGFDLSILHHQLERLGGTGLIGRSWRGPVLDVLVLDRHLDRWRPGKRRLERLCAHYGVDISNSHDAGADAAATLAVLDALCRRYPSLCAMDLDALCAHQARWHREWALSYDAWRARNALSRLEPSEFCWPLAGYDLFGDEALEDRLPALA